MIVPRQLLPLAVLFLTLALALAACTTPSGGTPSADARLDTLTPTNGPPGTQVEITGRIPAGAALHLCGVPLQGLQLTEPEPTATHFTRATGTVPTLTPGSTCPLIVVLDGQTVPHTGADVTFTTDAGAPAVPGAPTNLSATAGNATLAIAFALPGDGGSPITTLQYSLDGATWSEAATATSPLQLAGLINEQPITVRLRLSNAVGTGPASNPITATPTLWPFATGASSVSYAFGTGISTLSDGSAIVTGFFVTTADFGATTLTGTGDSEVFVAKTNPDGSWAWATSAGGDGIAQGAAVSALADGSAIVAGTFSFDATFGATTITSSGDYEVFVAKTNPDGSWAWATSAGGTRLDQASGIRTLADGSALIVGNFRTSATFGTTILTSAGNDDAFVAKTNPDGSWAWATSAGGTGGFTSAKAVSTLVDGSALIAGIFNATADFGAITLTSTGGTDAFVAKTNPDGSWAWATSAGGTGFDQALGMTALADGSAFIAGYFNGTADFGATTLTSAGGDDVFVAKTNPDGSWAWATSAGGTGFDQALGMTALADGSAFIAGYFNGTADFGATTLTSTGGADAFVAKTNPDGSWAWATSAGGTGAVGAAGVSTLDDGSALIVGSFRGSATFGTTTLTSAGIEHNVFVAKVSANGAW